MPEPPEVSPALKRVVRASERVKRAEGVLKNARQEYWAEIRRAHESDHSFAEIAKTLGITRQQVERLSRQH